MELVRLDLFGGLLIRPVGDAPVPLASRKAAALLGFLAQQAGRPQSRERLAGLLWDRVPEVQARTSLRQLLATLRKEVPTLTNALIGSADTVTLNAEAIGTDVAEFEAAMASGNFAHATNLYRGELLEGVRPGSLTFEAWLLPERERLRARAVAAMRALLDTAPLGREAAEAQVALAFRLLALDPAQEEVHRALMRLHARQRRFADALRQYEACRAALRRELDVAPDFETEALRRSILERRHSVAAGAVAEARVTVKPSYRLSSLPEPVW
jgi:DNA-binding SARP family transcriptional activator